MQGQASKVEPPQCPYHQLELLPSDGWNREKKGTGKEFMSQKNVGSRGHVHILGTV